MGVILVMSWWAELGLLLLALNEQLPYYREGHVSAMVNMIQKLRSIFLHINQEHKDFSLKIARNRILPEGWEFARFVPWYILGARNSAWHTVDFS